VLQWSTPSLAGGYDALIEIEGLLIDRLNDRVDVDGHDVGSGEMNIFILTNDPQAAFEQVRVILERRNIWSAVRVAYREISGNTFVILWPKHLTEFEVA
jgi:hypothetical protein